VVELCTIKDKKGKFGRYLARIMHDGLDVNDWLIQQGHAVPLVFKSDGVASE
jgi:micrococcal nuclease